MNTSVSARPEAPLWVRDLAVDLGGRRILEGIDLDFPAGAVTSIIGANGCGKSTLLRTCAGLISPAVGTVGLGERAVSSLRPRERARGVAMLPQGPVTPEAITVAELVARGRYAHRPWWGGWSSADTEAVENALHRARVADLADRRAESLSGGQRQRVWVAAVLAQEADVVLLDEPTTYLDLSHAVAVLDLVDELVEVAGYTVVMVLHDLTLAARYSDHLVVLGGGRVMATGEPAHVLTSRLLCDAFGLDAVVLDDPVTGRPVVVPLGERRLGDGTVRDAEPARP